VKRTAHLTVKITERPLKIEKVGSEGGGDAATARKSARAAKKAAASA
jgi:hypothetical protein